VGRRFEPVWAHKSRDMVTSIYNQKVIWHENRRFIIWGLKSIRHSHRYIHKGFFDTLKNLGLDVLWLDDKKNNQDLVKSGDIVIAVGIQSSYLPLNNRVHYVLHNFNSVQAEIIPSHIKLQVHTIDAKGENLDNSVSVWDEKERTLYQPWGIPESQEIWLPPTLWRSKKEFWVGLVWDNELNQGNARVIEEYKNHLKEREISFKKIGGTRALTRDGVSSANSFKHVNNSAIGAAIVGDWQQKVGYIPCRAFKNIAAGAIPISNSNLTHVFGDSYLYAPEIKDLIDLANNLTFDEIQDRSANCKESLKAYTYESALRRVLSVLV
jgi:hypothetical protein